MLPTLEDLKRWIDDEVMKIIDARPSATWVIAPTPLQQVPESPHEPDSASPHHPKPVSSEPPH